MQVRQRVQNCHVLDKLSLCRGSRLEGLDVNGLHSWEVRKVHCVATVHQIFLRIPGLETETAGALPQALLNQALGKSDPLLLKIDATAVLAQEIECPIALKSYPRLAKNIQCPPVNLLDCLFRQNLESLEPPRESLQHVVSSLRLSQ